MNRAKNHTLLLMGLLGLLVGCGEVSGGAGSISGTVSAPAGKSIFETDVFACFANEEGCEHLGVTLNQRGTTAAYRLSGLPVGSYGVYALKDVDDDGELGNGDLYAYYSASAGVTSLVSPPASNIDIAMNEITGFTQPLPEVLRDSITELQ